MNFGLIAVFVKVALEITKRALHCVLLIHMFSFFSKSRKSTCVQPVLQRIKIICKTNEL